MKNFLLSLLLASTCAVATNAADWGTVKGKFTYDGTAPKQLPIANIKAPFCAKQAPVVEELIVNPDNNGIANVVVYLYLKRGAKPPKAHPDYAATAKDEVLLDNKNCRFEPHILLLRTSQTLLIKNSDPEAHNAAINTTARKNPAQNNVIPVGQTAKATFKEPESVPATINCSVHPFMNARMVLKDHPYMAITDKDGNFEIKNMPVGKHTLQFWHEKCGYVKEAKKGGKKVTIKRGRLELTVKKGENDLGEYKLSTVFKGK